LFTQDIYSFHTCIHSVDKLCRACDVFLNDRGCLTVSLAADVLECRRLRFTGASSGISSGSESLLLFFFFIITQLILKFAESVDGSPSEVAVLGVLKGELLTPVPLSQLCSKGA
jgi:hypothetical protein